MTRRSALLDNWALSRLSAGALFLAAGCVTGVDPAADLSDIPPSMESEAADTDASVREIRSPELTAPALAAPDEPLDPARSAALVNASYEPAAPNVARQADYAEAMQQVAERQTVFTDMSEAVVLDGSLAQGGLVMGRTAPGAVVRLDGEPVMVGDDGRFVFGFGRDSALSALLVVTLPDGAVERRALAIEDREFKVQRIDGLDQSKVSGFTEAQLARIGEDRAKKNAARAETHRKADWGQGFDWPLVGRISGVFGSQRILNGEPKRPHSGLDIAAPTGTPIRAPAGGVVRLAEDDMYFEGGLILLDHGHWVESAFLHLSRLDVAPGQRIEKGEVIGAVGSTGRSTGPHLHWSVKWMGRLVDPRLLLGDPPASSNASPPASTGGSTGGNGD